MEGGWVQDVLTEAPSITVTAKAIAPGKQRVTVEWEYMQKEHVSGYIVNISRIPDSCRTRNESYKLSDTQFHVNLSLAFYKIWVAAENSAGFSPAASVMVPVSPKTEFIGKIFATVQKNNNIFLTWSPDIECDFFIINWGTNSSNMETRAVMEKQDNYSLTGPFEKWKKYIITIHLYPEMCFCGSFTRESTFGMTYIYAEESVPNAGPSNITIRNISKHSADIYWEEIPEKDCFGFLVGYKMYYTDMSQNKTLDVIVNSTSETSWKLTGLARGNKYEIKISGLTKKGEGILSAPYVFQTLLYDEGEFRMIVVLSCLGIIIIILLSASVCAFVLHRTKRWYFPKVPNPKHSNITKINEEISTKSVPRLLAPQDEHDGDSAHFEVVEVSSMGVSTLDESADEVDVSSIHETQTRFLKTNCQRSPCGKETPTTQGPAPHDYTGTKAVCKPAQRNPRTMHEIGRPQHMPADVTKKKTVLSFSDYIRENQSMN
ncbi:protein sidekick-2-like [Spea bombifrons]|uniref:protein sidekick-2-like n=1 Tax=Spea bombifrons TaxID=233779 RepID=UPI00234AE9D9|nr:protein sidekick-2-like [Spea bombifrons]